MRLWVLTVIVAAAPSLFLLTFFYLKDRYEREPLHHILMAFGLGLYAMIAAHGMASTAETWVPRDWLLLGGEPAKLFDAFILSATAVPSPTKSQPAEKSSPPLPNIAPSQPTA